MSITYLTSKIPNRHVNHWTYILVNKVQYVTFKLKNNNKNNDYTLNFLYLNSKLLRKSNERDFITFHDLKLSPEINRLLF